jgi:hypothetical protein
MKQWYATLLQTFRQDYDRRMQGLRGYYSPTTDVLAFVSLIECFNVYALLTYFVYPDCRAGTTCDAGCRATLAGISWVVILAANTFFFADNQSVRPLVAPASIGNRWPHASQLQEGTAHAFAPKNQP